MALILKTVLLLLFHLVYGQNIQDIEIILLPLWNAEDRSEVPLNFKAFDHSIELTLHKNDKIIAPQFQVWKHSDADTLEELPELNKPILCHYLHKDNLSSAAISLCGEHGMYGLVFLKNITLEIMPLQSQKISFFDNIKRSETLKEPHIVKRTYGPFTFFEDELKYYIPVYNHLRKEERNQNGEPLENINKNNMNDVLTLELALFFDETGYNLFSPFFDRNDEKILDMLLAYINGIQAVYHHPSLGIAIDISLVRLEIMQKQPEDLPHHDGERGKLLDSFCNYAKKNNPANEFNPNHWDMGLYVSGLDFYVMEDGQKNSATMGLAIVNGLCIEQYSCVIAELGVTNQFGKPFPSAGFTSIYVAAHEMGHNLGMHHDSTGNTCPKDGYIMSPSRGIYGETIWSECSREVAQKLPYTKSCLKDKSIHSSMNNRLDHTRFFNLPGREWTAKKQCEMFLRDKNAMVATFYKVCESLQCKTPHRNGYFFAGPALDGTYCAPGKECRSGECKNVLQIYPGLNKPSIEPGGWSEWKTGPCKSGCLLKSTGAQIRERFCNTSIPKNTEIDCQGLHFDIILCRDENLCNKKRKNINEFATLKCGEFSERLPELDAKSGGLQALHEPERPWMACAIFCRRKDIASYYTPRVELNDLGLDPYFPDGTWCHTEEGQNYFCRQHHCLPENFHFEKTLLNDRQNNDAEFSPQNALAKEIHFNDQIIKYLSLGPDGLPLLTSLPYNIRFPQDENEWIDKDYIELIKPTEETFFKLSYKKGIKKRI